MADVKAWAERLRGSVEQAFFGKADGSNGSWWRSCAAATC